MRLNLCVWNSDYEKVIFKLGNYIKYKLKKRIKTFLTLNLFKLLKK